MIVLAKQISEIIKTGKGKLFKSEEYKGLKPLILQAHKNALSEEEKTKLEVFLLQAVEESSDKVKKLYCERMHSSGKQKCKFCANTIKIYG